MTYTEKVAYINGLVEGLKLDENKDEIKVIKAMIDLLDEISSSLSDLEADYQAIVDQLDAVDEDLSEIEEEFYDNEEEDNLYEVECPKCQEVIALSNMILNEGKIECPNCGKNLEINFDDENFDFGQDYSFLTE